MTERVEFTPRDLAVAAFALRNELVDFKVPNAYEAGMGNVGRRATVSKATADYFKTLVSFSPHRRDYERHLANLLTLADDYNAHLSAPICLWVRESMNKLPQSRYKAVRRNCGLLVEILGLFAYHRQRTGLIVSQLDVVFMFDRMYGLKISRPGVKALLVKLADAGIIDLTLGEKNGNASKVKLRTSRDDIGECFRLRGSEDEADFIRNAERYSDTMEALKKDQALRRKAKDAAKSAHYDRMRGEELEAIDFVTEFLASGRTLLGNNDLVTREDSLVG